ncbi:HNH endonuclease [Erysipelothrix sp. HDW6B]|uniref:HNH endonuclease signature motif containing protein n=1 Tax=Erysipelothrix sp. HDW6B TaxID=2714929 RepID=UPI001409FE01|nr:HNH endonuclease signature motif containing protein [Erysipelothrix sp. HDW6B]QIK85840.1 HNH endonuclease [Erysipelothrix sp. HDW6B]
MKNNNKYRSEVVDFIRNNVKKLTTKEIAALASDYFGEEYTVSQIANAKLRYNIKTGERRGTFKKGHVPFNKGTKGMFNVGGNKTSFKKGQESTNKRPIGSERIDKDGYIMIKVSDERYSYKNWKPKHRVVWESVNGPVPKGHRIIFLDRDKQNVSIENLMLVNFGTSAVMSKKNLFHSEPEVTKSGALISSIEILTNKKSKLVDKKL